MTQLSVRQPEAAVLEPFLVGDVGGTYARLAVACEQPGEHRVCVSAFHKYACADSSDLAGIVGDFVDRHVDLSIRSGVLACAGYVLDGVIINENLPWKVDVASLRKGSACADLSVINDLEAAAYAIRYLCDDIGTWCVHEALSAHDGPQVIVAPGTGLGAAVVLPGTPRPVVMATEAGQIAMAPGNALEADILRVLASSMGRVTYEHVLSGSGLVNLYRALCALHGRSPEQAAPEAVTEAALHAPGTLARMAVDTFCEMLGAFVGDLAMLYGAAGGVWLAGGVLPKIRDLMPGGFTDRFLDKGKLSSFLATVPVRLIENEQLGVMGAAGWYLNAATHARDVSSLQVVFAHESEFPAKGTGVRGCNGESGKSRKHQSVETGSSLIAKTCCQVM